MIGKPIYFRFCGFNRTGGMEQPLAPALSFNFIPTGLFGQFALTYSTLWDNPSNQLAQSGSSIIVNPFRIGSAAGNPHYLGAGAAGSIAAAITLDGAGAAIDPTQKYYVYVADPNYTGESAALSLECVYEADLTAARAGQAGWFSLGSIQLASGGGGTGGGGGAGDPGGGDPKGPPYYF
jgi:hypothetical protein